jgi:hypothetical protein
MITDRFIYLRAKIGHLASKSAVTNRNYRQFRAVFAAIRA